MFMIDLPLEAAALMRFARRQGHAGVGWSAADEDFGYAAHAWLAATLGELAPPSFRMLETRTGLRLLGYAEHDLDALTGHAREFALPEALAVCNWAAAAGKAMPTGWSQGRRLGFEVRACPISRGERERDIYLVELERAKAEGRAPRPRTEIYAQWLMAQLEREGASKGAPDAINVIGFRRVRALRQSRAGNGPRHRGVERPDALFSGELIVGEPQAFARLLARGIGRHRAFGFGMLLLRPPARTSA